MKRKVENIGETTLSNMPNDLLQLISYCDPHDPLKLLIIFSSLNTAFYKALILIIKKAAIESLTLQRIVSDDRSTYYIMATGAVFACGDNSYGRLGIGYNKDKNLPVKLSLPAIAEIVTCFSAVFFLTTAGEVFVCEPYEDSVHEDDDNLPVKLALPAVAQIMIGSLFVFFRTRTGEIFVRGLVDTGDGSTELYATRLPLPLPVISEMSIGSNNSNYFITPIGDVFVWGENAFGQLGTGDTVKQELPVKLSLTNIAKIVTIDGNGVSSAFFLTKIGEVFACGSNRDCRLGIGNDTDQYSPVKLTLPPVVQIIANNNGLIKFLTTTGEVFAIRYGSAVGNVESQGFPVKLILPAVSQIVMNKRTVFFLTTTGEVFTYDGPKELGETPIRLNDWSMLDKISFDTDSSTIVSQMMWDESQSIFFLTSAGEVFVYEDDQYRGWIDLCNRKHSFSSLSQFELPVVSKILTQTGSTYFLTDTGEIFAYGKNDYGKLGIGTFRWSSSGASPVEYTYFEKAIKWAKTWDIPTLTVLTNEPGPNQQLFRFFLEQKKKELNPPCLGYEGEEPNSRPDF